MYTNNNCRMRCQNGCASCKNARNVRSSRCERNISEAVISVEESALKPLAIVYIENQIFRDLYNNDVGFNKGTIFRELDFPFTETKCTTRGGCRG